MAEPTYLVNNVNPEASLHDFINPPVRTSTTLVIEIDTEGKTTLVISQTDSSYIKPVMENARSSQDTAVIVHYDQVPFRIQKLISGVVQPLLGLEGEPTQSV